MSATLAITLYAKRDNTLDVTLQTQAGNPIDLRGYVLVCTVKGLLTDADNEALFQSNAPNAGNLAFGRFTFIIPLARTSQADWAAVTAAVYDVSTITPGGLTSTLLDGDATIIQPVTQDVAGATIRLTVT